MTTLTQSEQNLVREQPQINALNLSVFQPRAIMKALVNNGSITIGARTIAYDTVSLGSFSSVEAGMTLLVGTTDGGQELGRIRIRSVTSGQFVVAENSISWADNAFLTVQRYWEVWPVYPRIISDPADAENVIFYKDYDIGYSDQNANYGVFACAGPHRAAYIDETTGVARIYWSSEDSSALNGTISTYEWAFEGGNPTGSTSAVPGYVEYSTPGHYVTRLKITTSLGVTETTYRYVSIYHKPGFGSSIPPQKWVLNEIHGSRGEGGYTLNMRLYENVDAIKDGAVVVLFGDDWYGSTKYSLGGTSTGNASIFLTGYVLKGSIHYAYDRSYVDFQVGSVTEQMKLCESFVVSIEDKPTASTWFQLQDMTISKAIYHYLRWHSTILSITDFLYLGPSRPLQYFDSDRESLFDAIDNFMRSALVGQITSNRQGRIYAEVNIEAVNNASGTYPVNMYLGKHDWMEEPVITENLSEATSYVETGGIAYLGGVSGTFNALLACAPGDAPLYRGKSQRISGLALVSQAQLNALAGDLLASYNAKYPRIDIPMVGAYKNLDIAPQEALQVDINPEDTARNISIHAPYITQEIFYNYDPEQQHMTSRIGVKAITGGTVGQTIVIPPVPDGGGYGNPNLNIGAPILAALPALVPLGSSILTFGQWFCTLSGLKNSVLDVLSVTLRSAWTWTESTSDFYSGGLWQFTTALPLGGPGIRIRKSGWYLISTNGTLAVADKGSGPMLLGIRKNGGRVSEFSVDTSVFSSYPSSVAVPIIKMEYFFDGDQISVYGEFPNMTGNNNINISLYFQIMYLGT